MAAHSKLPPGDRMQAVLGMDDLTAHERIVLADIAWYDGPGGCFSIHEDNRL